MDTTQTAVQNNEGLEKIARISVVLNGTPIDVQVPDGPNRYFRLRLIGAVPSGHHYDLTIYRGPQEQNGYKTFGRETQQVGNGELYRIADGAKQLHFSKQDG